MRPYLFGSLATAVGAVAGALLAVLLKVGKSTGCFDVNPQQGLASCAAPSAAPWAVALGALVGASLAVAATAVVVRQRR